MLHQQPLNIDSESRFIDLPCRPADVVWSAVTGLRGLFLAIGVFISAAFLCAGAMAAAGPWVKGNNVEARLISAIDAVGEKTTLPVGVEMRLTPGWKTYWRSPGDAGLPPRADWSASTNVEGAAFRFPAPERFALFGLQTFGYSKHVILPVDVRPKTPGAPISLNANLNVLVCENICIPETLDLALDLPSGPAVPSEQAQALSRFANQVPNVGDTPLLSVAKAEALKMDGRDALRVTVTSQQPLQSPDVFVELTPPVPFEKPEIVVSADQRTATLTLLSAADLPTGQRLAKREATLTVVDGDHAIEKPMTVAAGTAPVLLERVGQWLMVLSLALVGGFILNFMPCVLPVLSIKLLSLLKHSTSEQRRTRLSFLSTAAGIVASMLALAGVLVALSAGGQTIGWGIQFQEPVFVAAMAVIVTLFAANLWGFFEIVLPGAVSNFAGQAEGRAGQGFAGDFAAGVFATLLATPCSAPFIGTAVGFALSGGPALILAVFAALGVGLALPYLVIAGRPSLARYLPKPGPWMVRLKIGLGFALAATALWLVWVLSKQSGTDTAFAVGSLLVIMVGVLAFTSRIRALAGDMIPAGVLTVVLALMVVSAPLVTPRPGGVGGVGPGGVGGLATLSRAQSAGAEDIPWATFDRDRIKSLVAQGKTVFVDVTADWCIVCKTNKAVAIDTETVAARLKSDVMPVRADWTSPDPAISAYLASHGRYGIPLNVVYGPARPRGILLPEILTVETIITAFDQAMGRKTAAN